MQADVRVTVFDYDPQHLSETEITDFSALAEYRATPTSTWINIDGLHSPDLLSKIGEAYGIHPLVLEDILTTSQRPKLEIHDDYLYLVLRMVRWDPILLGTISEQVSMVLTPHVLLTFQERTGDTFNNVRERLRKGKGRVRRAGVDYLAYALIDSMVDGYFVVIDEISELLQVLDDRMVEETTDTSLTDIHNLKRELLLFRRSVLPLREALRQLINMVEDEEQEPGQPLLVQETTVAYYRDVMDHLLQVLDGIETYMDLLSSMQQVHYSTLSQRMNEIMKVLTVISTIFIPLTFLVGVYGMNFEVMPELRWTYSYPVLLVLMLAMAMIMVHFFRRRGWL